MANFQLYRKALAALLVAVLGALAAFIPGVEAIVSPTEIQMIAGVAAAIAVAVTADKLDGASVVDLARMVVEALDRAKPLPDGAALAGVADGEIKRKGDAVPLRIAAVPVSDGDVERLARAKVEGGA